jgi:hypothetical protein
MHVTAGRWGGDNPDMDLSAGSREGVSGMIQKMNSVLL